MEAGVSKRHRKEKNGVSDVECNALLSIGQKLKYPSILNLCICPRRVYDDFAFPTEMETKVKRKNKKQKVRSRAQPCHVTFLVFIFFLHFVYGAV